MAEVTSESLVIAQQVSSLSSSLRLWQRVKEERQCLSGDGFPSHSSERSGCLRGLCGASLCNRAGVYVQ